uniref:R-spondin 1 n=1 Tax=Eptatretus burgeri TaxID=7764 RepID=A0A8C4QB14_EPTBU
MLLYLLPLVLVWANAMDRALDRWSSVSRTRRQTRLNCPKGCHTCSKLNGCITCLPRYFIYLERLDMQQVGSCLSSCPEGHFGVRRERRGVSICQKCKLDNCDTCFSRNFCMSCKGGFLLHRGTCHEACPRGFIANNRSSECRRTSTPGEKDKRRRSKEMRNRRRGSRRKGKRRRNGRRQTPSTTAADTNTSTV